MYELMPRASRGTNTFRPSDQTHGVATSHIPPHPNTGNGTDGSDDDHPTPPPTSPPINTQSVVSDTSHPPADASNLGSGGKRKRSALDDVTGSADKRSPSLSLFTSVSRDKRKGGGNSATMNRLNETLDGLGAHLASVSKQQQQLSVIPDNSPERRVQAMKKLQLDEPNMDIPRMTALVDMFRCSTEAADTYLALFREDVRKGWVERQLTGALGFPPLSPLDLHE
jgi:hypothetical protein